MKHVLCSALALAMALTATQGVSADRGLDAMLEGRSPMSKSALKKAIAKAEQEPLGSRGNPVRVEMPEGQRAYLASLRCADGTRPRYERAGNVGLGVYQSIIDLYQADCGDAAPGKVEIYMNMYRPGHVETRPVPGFSVAASDVGGPTT